MEQKYYHELLHVIVLVIFGLLCNY